MRQRLPIERPADSRVFTDQALAELRAARWAPHAWACFLARCSARSWEQVRVHRRGAVEITLLHLALVPVARRSPLALLGSWLLALTHLGLLGPGTRSIGLPNALSLVRANLPVTPLAPLLAMGSDVADGWLARQGGPTAFGGYADALADVTFWTRFGVRRSGPMLGWLALAAWATPAAAITVAYFARGRAIDYPRLIWMRRLSAALQCVIAVSSFTRGASQRRDEWLPVRKRLPLRSRRTRTTSSTS